MLKKLSIKSATLVPDECDVAIIGAGPAGLATAIELKRLGVSDILVLERSDTAGGNPRHCGHSPFGMHEFKRIYLGPGYAEKTHQCAIQAGVKICLNTTVICLGENALLTLSTPQGVCQLKAKKVVLTTGIRETPRAPRFVSGQRPVGIMTSGALQSMVYAGNKKPFKNPIIIGTELVSFSAIISCRHVGVKPRALIEENARLTAWSSLQLLPRVLGITILTETQILNIEGKHRVTGVNLINAAGKTDHIACDGIIFSGKFIPEASLPRSAHLAIDPHTQGPIVDQFARCSDPDYFAAGNVLRPVETAGWCWHEGVQTAKFVNYGLSGRLPDTKDQRHIQIRNNKIKYIVPQRISLSISCTKPPMMKEFQLRFEAPANGIISIYSDNTEIYSKKINTLPERRVLIPIPKNISSNSNENLSINYVAKIQ